MIHYVRRTRILENMDGISRVDHVSHKLLMLVFTSIKCTCKFLSFHTLLPPHSSSYSYGFDWHKGLSSIVWFSGFVGSRSNYNFGCVSALSILEYLALIDPYPLKLDFFLKLRFCELGIFSRK